MKLAFVIYGYFPYGGQQRDFLRVALACAERGHEIEVYTMKWEGDIPAALRVHIVDIRAWRNHARYERFVKAVQAQLQHSPADAVIGFNKMPGLDVYFAADPCFAERALKERAFYYRLTPRYRHFLRYEQAVFGPSARTQALLLSPLQHEQFLRHYPQSGPRLHDIPPGIARDRQAPENAAQIRAQWRAEFGLDAGHLAVLQVGSGFVVKGVDRSLHALASLPPAVRKRVRYFHLELEAHGLLLSEGTWSESYLDDGNRHVFNNAALTGLFLDFEAGRAKGEYDHLACLPVLRQGLKLDEIHGRIALRAQELAQAKKGRSLG